MRYSTLHLLTKLTYRSPNFNLVDFATGGATWLSELAADGILATKRDGRLSSLPALPKHLELFRWLCNVNLDFIDGYPAILESVCKHVEFACTRDPTVFVSIADPHPLNCKFKKYKNKRI
jgi:hypothetical protein